MTTNHLENEPAVRERFAIPPTFEIGATIPLGLPHRPLRPADPQPRGPHALPRTLRSGLDTMTPAVRLEPGRTLYEIPYLI